VTDRLASLGGDPVWAAGWPAWPQIGPDTMARVGEVLAAERWAVSGPWAGRAPRDIELAERFATFVGARWCVPVDHGSSALMAAFTALGIGPGDEVIVPGLTWVACASTVVRAGAIPILVDIDPDTLCLDPAAVEAQITPATAAILVVHLYSAMADMDRLRSIAHRHGLSIIEDSAQAYGATWRGAGAGTLGDAGTFSAQQGKALTSGEGGLLVTSSPEVRDAVEMLRGDGRRYSSGPHTLGRPDLEEREAVQGWNMHMTELQAALLLDGLERLPEQNRRREAAARLLDDALTEDGDLEPIRPYAGNDGRAYYHYAIRVRDGAFSGCGAAAIAEALSAELGYWVHPPYRPLNDHPLYDPRRLTGPAVADRRARLDPRQFDLPAAHREVARTILLHHPMLLGDHDHLHAIVAAFAKVRRLAGWLSEQPGEPVLDSLAARSS
jgi:dTDP-4-amino-4,6-dideoxygalactose transaminase